MAEPVFYDPQRARWKRLRRLVDVVVAALSALIIFFVYTALRDERSAGIAVLAAKARLQGIEGK